MLALGCAPHCSATRTNRRFSRASPKSAPASSAAAQLPVTVSVITCTSVICISPLRGRRRFALQEMCVMDRVLDRLHRQLQQTPAGHATAIVGHAVHGLGGVGKTRLAVEYAWRHSRDYRALLFITASTPQGLEANLAALVGPKA